MEKITHLIDSKEFGKTLKDVSDSEYRRLRDNYDKFTSHTLDLLMFVPCDEEGNVLEDSETDLEKHLEYETAKQRCLFEGWGIIGIDEGLWELENSNQNLWVTFIGKDAEIINFDGYEESIKTLEEMFDYCKDRGFMLHITPAALNQIY